MTGWSSLSDGKRAAAGVGAAVLLAALGYFGYQSTQTAQVPADEALAVLQSEVSAPEVIETGPVGEPTPESAPEPVRPMIDLVRIDNDSAVISGRAQPGATLTVLLDGTVIDELTIDGSGEFVLLPTLPQSTAPMVFTLMMTTPDGLKVASEQAMIVQPAAPTVEVAQTKAADSEQTPRVAEADENVSSVDGEGKVAEAAPDPEMPDVSQSSVSSGDESAADVSIVQSGESAEPAVLGAEVDQAQAPEKVVVALAGTAVVEAEVVADATSPATTAQTDVAEGSLADAQATDEQQVAEELQTAVATAQVSDEVTNVEAVETSADASETKQATTQNLAEKPTAPAVLMATEEGIEVVQAGGAAPAVLQDIALDSISYDPSGDVTLAGRSTGPGFVRVYIDNAPIKTLAITADGRWRAPLPEVDTGVYTLRIDEIDSEGTVVSRVETPFKREEPADLAALTTDQAPEDGIRLTVVTVQPGNTLWGIASKNYGEGSMYVRVFEANKDRIGDPDLIYPGQVFQVPE